MIYDLIVLGGGPGGYLAAERAAHAGLKTLVLEKRALGGVCLNEGCIPSKTLLNSAKHYDHALHGGAYGVTCADVRYDQQAVVKRKAQVVRTLVSGVRAKLKAVGAEVVMEDGRITGKTADGFTLEAAGKTYTGKRLIIATGSSAVIPPIPGVQENLGGFVLTNREVLDLPQIPEKLTVVGGGVIGLEMAAYYATVGSRVTVVEMLSHIAGATDRQISTMLQKELETIGVRFDRRGIPVDSMCRTNVENVYAVGDVNGKYMLAHTAYREAEVAVNNLLGKQDTMRYHANPAVIYTQPEIASVGKTEEECKEKGIDYEVRSLSMRYSGRFVAENEGADGLCKILVDQKRRTVLGVHMIGAYAGEIIWGAAEMLEMPLRVTDARQIIFPHPTVSEIIREVLWEFDD